MRMSKFGLIGAAIVLGSCVAAVAIAQDAGGQPPAAGGGRRGGGQGRGGGFGGGGFGQGRFGGGFGGLTLVNVPADVLAKELKLTDEQKTGIAAAQMKYQTDLRASFQPPVDGGQVDRQAMQAKTAEISAKAIKEIEDLLKDKKADAAVIVKYLSTLQTLRIPYQTYSDLKLSTEVRTKLTALAADVTKDRTAKQQEMRAAQQAGDQAKMQELMQAMRGTGQPDEKTLALLSADQKEVITKYTKDHPPVGGPGGRRPGFGPGAGTVRIPPPVN